MLANAATNTEVEGKTNFALKYMRVELSVTKMRLMIYQLKEVQSSVAALESQKLQEHLIIYLAYLTDLESKKIAHDEASIEMLNIIDSFCKLFQQKKG